MSQYVNFYLKTPKGEFVSLFDFSRSSDIYQACSGAPYEKIRQFSYDDLSRCKDYIQDLLQIANNGKEKLLRNKEDLLHIQNPNKDILDKLNEIYEDMDSLEKEKEEIVYADEFFNLIERMLDNFKYREIKEDEQRSSLWYGIEAPIYPTEEDIIE